MIECKLGQPTQGSHPGESGYSVLDYLLEGKIQSLKIKVYF